MRNMKLSEIDIEFDYLRSNGEGSNWRWETGECESYAAHEITVMRFANAIYRGANLGYDLIQWTIYDENGDEWLTYDFEFDYEKTIILDEYERLEKEIRGLIYPVDSEIESMGLDFVRGREI